MNHTETAVAKVRQGLESGALCRTDLTARRLAEYLGGTTSLLYHHFGSLDGFLRAVSDDAFERFEASLAGFESRPADREAFLTFAKHYIDFAYARPSLYELMFSRQLRQSEPPPSSMPGRERRTSKGRVMRALVTQFRKAGSVRAKDDARLFHASLHGLVSLGMSGRSGCPEEARTQSHAAA